MTSEFLVITTSRFDRELKKLASRRRGMPEVFRRVIDILKTDPTTVAANTQSRSSRRFAQVKANTESVPGAFDSATTSMVKLST